MPAPLSYRVAHASLYQREPLPLSHSPLFIAGPGIPGRLRGLRTRVGQRRLITSARKCSSTHMRTSVEGPRP
ncbi:MAG: hypothetical protein ACYDAG_04060, partial [Chloroflexota bacterium]